MKKTEDEVKDAKSPVCDKHPDTELVCPRCRNTELGHMTTPAKADAARENGKLGGRPRGSTYKARNRHKNPVPRAKKTKPPTLF